MRVFSGMLLSVALMAVLASGCKKAKPTAVTAPPTGSPAPASAGGEPDSAFFPGLAGGIAANPQASGGGGGGGTIQAVRGAAKRAATMNDLQQIRTFIEDASLTSGRMPTAQETYAALKSGAPNIAALIDDGTIVLNNARTREDVWAYDAAALTNGGLMLTSSGVERVDAATLRQRLGR